MVGVAVGQTVVGCFVGCGIVGSSGFLAMVMCGVLGDSVVIGEEKSGGRVCEL